jgi:hypothetical protein
VIPRMVKRENVCSSQLQRAPCLHDRAPSDQAHQTFARRLTVVVRVRGGLGLRDVALPTARTLKL